MSKGKLTLSIEEEKIKEFKKLAIDYGMTVSDYLTIAGTITDPIKIKTFKQHLLSKKAK